MCLKTDKYNFLCICTVDVATSQHRAVSQAMCLNGLSTDKQSFACLMQVAVIEVRCCQPFF